MMSLYRPRSSQFLIGIILISTHTATPAEIQERVVYASNAGAILNSDLIQGGGTDDTVALQSVLDRAADGKPIHLIIDGRALVRGLNVHGKTTLECIHGGGLYLKNGSSRTIVRNANRSKQTIIDEHITIRGCFLNGNRGNQPSADVPSRVDIPGCCTPSNKESDGTFISGMEFLGVNDLIIENTTLWNIRAFGVLIANASRIAVQNLTVDYGSAPGILDRRELNNTDGLVFKGPLRYAAVDGLRIRAGDDALALNADTWTDDANLYGPYVGVGPITDVTVNNIQLMDTILGVRSISASERVDRINITNMTGTIRGWYVANLSHWVNPSGLGNFGSVTFYNVNVDRSIDAATSSMMKTRAENYVRRLTTESKIDKKVIEQRLSLSKNWNAGNVPYFAVNGHMETLNLRNIVTKVTDDRPIIWLGPDARIHMLTADLTLLDPTIQAVPLQLDNNSRIDRLDFALRWISDVMDEGRKPIVSLGGTVGQINWLNTPPMYESGELRGENSVVVTFTQPVKAIDLIAGVTIKINGTPVDVSRAMVESGRPDAVRYVLDTPLRALAPATWSYAAEAGHIINLSGDPLLSVSEKTMKRTDRSTPSSLP